MHATSLIFTSLLCLGLLGACTGADNQEQPPAQAEETRIPGVLQNQFDALDKTKSLQNKLQKQQTSQQRQVDDSSH